MNRVCVQGCEGGCRHFHWCSRQGLSLCRHSEEGSGELFISLHLSIQFIYWIGIFNIYSMNLQDKLLDQTCVTHLFPITKYLGLLATGLTGLNFPFLICYMTLVQGFWLIIWLEAMSTSLVTLCMWDGVWSSWRLQETNRTIFGSCYSLVFLTFIAFVRG